jgi:preprotein translocase subunit SecG
LFAIFVVFHILVCLSLIIVVLMQSSKGEGLAGSSFAGGVSGAVFGGRGAGTFLSKATTYLAIVFFVSCGTLAFMSAGQRVTSSGTTTSAESAVTKQAQEQMQRQQQQQAPPGVQEALPLDTSKGGQTPIQVTPGSAQPTGTDKK